MLVPTAAWIIDLGSHIAVPSPAYLLNCWQSTTNSTQLLCRSGYYLQILWLFWRAFLANQLLYSDKLNYS